MGLTFPEGEYRKAWNAAILLARQLGRETGLERGKELDGKTIYRIIHLPGERFRQGHELRCQVVRPDEPLLRYKRRPIAGL